jgi:hypothetical protein
VILPVSKIKKNIKWSAGLVVLGAFFLVPIVSYAADDTEDTVINATIASTISLTTSGTVAIDVTPITGGSQSSAADTVTVSTNNSTGYALTLADADTNTALESGANTIAAHAGTQASPTALANNRWGYRIDGTGGFGSGPTTALDNASSSSQTFAGVPSSASPNTILTTSSTASGEATTVWFSVKTDTTKPSGVYTDTVTYTATTNP